MSKRYHSGAMVLPRETALMKKVTGAATLHAMFMRVAFAKNAYVALGLEFDAPFSQEDVDSAVAEWRQLYDDSSILIPEHGLWDVAYATQRTVEDVETWLLLKRAHVYGQLWNMVVAALQDDASDDEMTDE
jgi:hypothetical protein